ncbi:gamma-glutamyltransferase family protein [Oceanicella actignis]|uniref:gamma-glutamyltransferase family protein n=1 Tax=Oceanicella actignis TaxID=1189325 RepID=UPI0011E680DF|nr:gamma-glutamyltransferase family protein [Oceanicella actignis]TYO91491.1 gamma-glutamyltranspeptidase/glutathione hydrolase [Oceanicella actignis]
MSYDRTRDFQKPGRSQVIACNGMCATSHPLAAKAAVEVMEQGGNAVDAAIAAAVLLGICEPQMTGLGGDCFALVAKPDGAVIGLNGSGRAPAALSAEALRAQGFERMPERSPHAVTLPGAVDAFDRLSRDHGRLGLAASLAQAIRYAEEGVPVAPRVAFDWARGAQNLSGAAREFYLIEGAAPRAGQVFRAPRQAEILRRIAAQGRAAFYEGEVAQDMVDTLRALGGVHTMEDFAAVESEYVEPVSGDYRGVELVELPPNGQGATAILMANILRRFDLSALDPFGAKRAHLEAEATRLAYDARDRFIADPEHAALRLGHMLSERTAERLAALIDPERALPEPVKAATEAVHRETVYVSVVDKDRMAVSLIYSIFHSFGSGLASERFGVLMHNRGACFNLIPGHPNEAAGGKRPMHTIIPALLRRGGAVTTSFGVMGGAYQPCGHVRHLTNLVDYGMEPQVSMDGPRSFFEKGALTLERGYDAAAAERLAQMGHRVERAESPIGGSQSVTIDRKLGVLIGASDPRKDGCALGY